MDGGFLQQPTEKAKASLTKFGIAMDHKLLQDLQLLGANCVFGWGERVRNENYMPVEQENAGNTVKLRPMTYH